MQSITFNTSYNTNVGVWLGGYGSRTQKGWCSQYSPTFEFCLHLEHGFNVQWFLLLTVWHSTHISTSSWSGLLATSVLRCTMKPCTWNRVRCRQNSEEGLYLWLPLYSAAQIDCECFTLIRGFSGRLARRTWPCVHPYPEHRRTRRRGREKGWDHMSDWGNWKELYQRTFLS